MTLALLRPVEHVIELASEVIPKADEHLELELAYACRFFLLRARFAGFENANVSDALQRMTSAIWASFKLTLARVKDPDESSGRRYVILMMQHASDADLKNAFTPLHRLICIWRQPEKCRKQLEDDRRQKEMDTAQSLLVLAEASTKAV